MKHLIKNYGPYKKIVLLIFLLITAQCYCDMTLPQYTQDLIDVGIQNAGVEHILPTQITESEYEAAQVFMSDKEKEAWESAYEKEGDIYVCSIEDDKELDKLDDKLLQPIVMTYQMGHMSEDALRDMLKGSFSQNPQMASMAERISDMSLEEIEAMLHVEFDTFEAEDENGVSQTYVDMRPIIQDMIASGVMDAASLDESKDKMDEMLEAVGSQTLMAMGYAYAADCNNAAGIDGEALQEKYLWICGAKMMLLALCMTAFAALVSMLSARVGAGIGRTLRRDVFSNVMGYSNAEMDQFSTSSLITRATNDIQQVQMTSMMILRMVLMAPIMAIWGIIKVYQTKAHMSFVIVAGVLVLLSLVGVLMAFTMPKFRIMQKLVDGLNAVSREILTGIPVIRAFGRERTEEERFEVANRALMRNQLFVNRVMTLMSPLMMIVMYAITIVITWIAAHRIDAGTLQVGAMTAFITYAMMIITSFLIITAMSVILPRAGVAAERIDEVRRTKTSIADKKNATELSDCRGVVRFNHVSFRYPGADDDVIHDIDFEARPGVTTAIIGSTGSGKTTIVNLIPRFYDVTEGSVEIDGIDVRDYSIESLRRNIGLVPQKGVLFSGTIASNIRFGNNEATDDEVKEFAKIAQAEDFIEEKEEKYESFISQGGTNVSGGQKQRLSIARALAKKPAILIFDDSFSALDMKTDAELRKELAEKQKDATKIIVAQRVGTILHAEQIIVLDDGEVVGKGTHEELLESCDVYRQIAESQLSEKELKGVK
ncbi:MAG: ABC transporter ATP-binding protein [Firmicutes bacterium]|nr:ABC transporter ATP-binding protein [Bacillota bacterium]